MQRPKFNRSGTSGMLPPHVVKRKSRKMKRSGTFHVYILECRDKTYYTGYTNDLERRLKQHSSGKGGARYTAWKKAGDLVWKKEYKRFKPAFLMEKRIKTLTRKQKELLVGGMRLDKVLGKKKCKNSGANKAVKKDKIKKNDPLRQNSGVNAEKEKRESLAPKYRVRRACGASNPKRFGMAAKSQRVYIRTFGCQMNDRDSEALLGLFLGEGYKQAKSEKEADVILVNTCSVRDHAENRALSFLGSLKKFKRVTEGRGTRDERRKTKSSVIQTKRSSLSPQKIVGLIGCMAKNRGDEVFSKMPHVDLVCGPAAFFRLPDYIKEIQARGLRVKDLEDRERDESFYGAVFRESRNQAQVVISTGCSNYCSYCVVPYTRGKLRPRSPESIIAEIKENIRMGRKKITLLGQNVNDYRSALALSGAEGFDVRRSTLKTNNFVDFVGLLKMIDRVEGLEELDFVTSNPKNTSEELFKFMAESKKIKKHLHLPFQSGSDRILKLMGRGYTRKKYIELAAQYKKITKGTLGTDIIVGFPTETEEDFEQTLDLVKEAKFKYAFIFKYSPRLKTKASRMKDDVPESIKKKRHKKLLDLQKEISRQYHS